ncbi:MAG: hypothetical protein Q9209_001221 [Squamulea sp. 1 TL-2023]
MAWFKVNQDFAPSKRAFQSQIKKWNFPSKHVPPHLDPGLVSRVRELWAQNVSQKNMLAVLQAEGFQDLTERQLGYVREKEGLKLRIANNKSTPKNDKSSTSSKRKRDGSADQDLVNGQPSHVRDQSPQSHDEANTETTSPAPATQDTLSTDLTEEVVQKRQAWHQKLQAESLERLEKRTRRRRTKVYAGLPPDPPAPPRFPSETTLEEAKVILHLDKSTYTTIRTIFENICKQHNVVKKTEAGHDKWQAVKSQLIDEFPPIQPLFRITNQQQLDHHFLALEMICNDVTKKLRTMKTRVTVADAKNVLGLNPEEGRQLKAAFHKILRADHFTSKLEAGPEHWQELKQKWISQTPLLQPLLSAGEADPQHKQKVKALEHLCRDVMKRLRDSQTKEEKLRKAGGLAGQSASPQATNATTPAPRTDACQSSGPDEQSVHSATSQGATYDGISTLASQALASAHLPVSPPPPPPQAQHQQHVQTLVPHNNQIDPTLLSAAASLPPYSPGQGATAPGTDGFAPTPVYFRLSPTSQVKTPPTVWVDELTTLNVSTVRQLAVSNRPYSNLRVARIEGLFKSRGSEMKLVIDDDDELMAYLDRVKEATPTFVVDINYDV